MLRSPFHAKALSTQRPQSPTTPCPSSTEEWSPEFPSSDKEALRVVDFRTDPLFS